MCCEDCSQSKPVEQVRGFTLKEKTPLVINDLHGNKSGILELQALVPSKEPVLLFRGAFSASECEAQLEAESRQSTFLLGAVAGQAARARVDPRLGPITLFSKSGQLGFVRLVQD